jgi:hypothetical protein
MLITARLASGFVLGGCSMQHRESTLIFRFGIPLARIKTATAIPRLYARVSLNRFLPI